MALCLPCCNHWAAERALASACHGVALCTVITDCLCPLLQCFNIAGDTINSLDVSNHFPQLKLVTLIDQKKVASSMAGMPTIDWRFNSANDGLVSVQSALLGYMQQQKQGLAYFKDVAAFNALMAGSSTT